MLSKFKCSICNHPDRAGIENAILSMTSAVNAEDRRSIEDIATEYEVSLDELKMHALFHTPLVSKSDLDTVATTAETEDASTGRDSLMRKMKLREADMLSAVSNEYLVTLKAMGRRLNKLVSVSSIDVEDEDKVFRLSKLLTKPMVDMYIGLGNEIRQNVKTMAEMDRMLNGPQDNPMSGLTALAQAIRGSGSDDA